MTSRHVFCRLSLNSSKQYSYHAVSNLPFGSHSMLSSTACEMSQLTLNSELACPGLLPRQGRPAGLTGKQQQH